MCVPILSFAPLPRWRNDKDNRVCHQCLSSTPKLKSWYCIIDDQGLEYSIDKPLKSPWKVLEFIDDTLPRILLTVNQSRNVFFIFINTTVWVKNTKYASKHYLTISPKVTPKCEWLLKCTLFSNLEIMQGGLPCAVSAEHFAFLKLHVHLVSIIPCK